MSADVTAVRYQIDPSASRLTVKVTASGFLSAMGHNPTIAVNIFSAEVRMGPDGPQSAKLRLTAKTDSLEVTDDISQKDKAEIQNRTRQEVLESARFPDAVFETTGITATTLSDSLFAVNLTGNLTLHGATRSQLVACQVSLNGDSIRGYGECVIKQSDFGIRLVSVAAGALKVKDEVKCSFDITLNKQA
ncbi:MAG: YceI family protein [Candidatus Acidiferrales bacterium]